MNKAITKRYDLTDDKGNYVGGKSCNICEEIYPDTFEYFYRYKHKTSNTCKNCAKIKTQKYNKK